MDSTVRRSELKAFLRARREALLPESIGLAPGKRRRTPGLRREEVAALADVGVTWYTWLEQGREIGVSMPTLLRIARALRLTPTDERYFLGLAGLEPAHADTTPPRYPVEPTLKAVLDALRTVPAIVFSPCLDAVAFNQLADAILDYSDGKGLFARNHAWLLFMDHKWRALYGGDWEAAARRCVGQLRLQHAKYFGDPRFEALLEALQVGSREFVRFWNERRTAPLEIVEIRWNHRHLGYLKVNLLRLLLPMQPDFTLSTVPPADAKTAAAFASLARTISKRGSVTRPGIAGESARPKRSTKHSRPKSRPEKRRSVSL
jgi:transcriptional regulator with XRE-family HTH domain